jgi:hypothetical protein
MREIALMNLLSAASLEDAAMRSGISLRTLKNWLADAEFKQMFKELKAGMLASAVDRLRLDAREMATILAAVARNKRTPPAQKVSAARAVLELLFTGTEVLDQEERLSRLKKELERVGR